jgi:hypothetical protein
MIMIDCASVLEIGEVFHMAAFTSTISIMEISCQFEHCREFASHINYHIQDREQHPRKRLRLGKFQIV